MIKDGYYEGKTTWMRLKVPNVGFLRVSRSCKSQQRHDVCSQRRDVIHSNLEKSRHWFPMSRHYSFEFRKRHDMRTGSGVWNPPNVATLTHRDVGTS